MASAIKRAVSVALLVLLHQRKLKRLLAQREVVSVQRLLFFPAP